MSLLLRKVRQARWDPAVRAPEGPLPADPLADLNTHLNTLSFWLVADDRSDLDVVATGLAAAMNEPANLDVLLLGTQALDPLGIQLTESEGRTPLAAAREHHRNLEGLTADKLVQLADLMRKQGQFVEFTRLDCRNLLSKAAVRGDLDPSALQSKVREDLERRGLMARLG